MDMETRPPLYKILSGTFGSGANARFHLLIADNRASNTFITPRLRMFPMDEFECRYAIQSRHNLVRPCVVFHQRTVLKYDIYSKKCSKAWKYTNPTCIRQLEYCPYHQLNVGTC
jgi:hypothetical protein